jgi:integrase
MLARQEKKQLAAFEASQTFELIAKEWHTARYDRWSKRHADNILRRLELDVFPEIGNIPVVMLSAPHVIACLQKNRKT